MFSCNFPIPLHEPNKHFAALKFSKTPNLRRFSLKCIVLEVDFHVKNFSNHSAKESSSEFLNYSPFDSILIFNLTNSPSAA